MADTYADAVAYVATTPTSGLAQYVLLHRVGLGPADSIAEVGCGALHFAKVALAAGHEYAGIDPHPWLAAAACAADPVLDDLVVVSDALFSTRDDFDVRRAFAARFDWILSHSILSHASRHQIRSFFRQTADAAVRGVLVSANLVDRDSSIHDAWVYPGAVTVTRAELFTAAYDAGFAAVEERPDLAALYRSWCPAETHDWIFCGC